MHDTPIIDMAIRAGCKALDVAVGIDSECRHPSCDCGNKKAVMLAALRAALPWDLPAERLEVMVRGAFRVVEEIPQGYLRVIIAAYRADPIMRELYPEKFQENTGGEGW
jgi:hypothetical protein